MICMTDRPFVFYAGGYAQPGENGILKCAFDGSRFEVLDANAELCRPSWLLKHPDRPLLYAVEELTPEGRVAVLSEEGGRLRVLASVPTRGADPCHLALTPDRRHLLAANYTGGSLAAFELDADGIPARMTDFLQHPADPDALRGGDPARQEGPHIHFSLCEGGRVYLCDLGLNRVYVYGWDAAGGRLTGVEEIVAFPDGAGPRHLAFGAGGARLYAVCELDATVHVFARADGAWRRVQTVSTLPDGAGPAARSGYTAAAIRFAGARTLCASTRGHDSIAVFDVGADGLLSGRRIVPSGGRMPRDILPARRVLLAANQDGNRIAALDGARGEYAGICALEAVRPTCLCPAE